MAELTKVAKNSKGVCIEYGKGLEDKIRSHYLLSELEQVTDSMVFSFFFDAHSNAMNKGYAIDERE